MFAIANVNIPTLPPEVRITHKGQELNFSVSRFGREIFQKVNVFEHINRFWDDLPIIQQDRVFDIYKEIQEAYDMHLNRQALTDYITDHVTELMDIHNLTTMNDWISFKTTITIPDKFVSDYVHDINNNLSREKTYTRSDYKEIVALSLSMRCMIPVWGDYISTTRHDTGNDFKEFYAFQLLRKSYIINSQPILKLRTYIQHLTVDKHTPDNVLRGISSEDFVYWLLALLCVKRLTIADIRGDNPEANIITYIYKFIVQKIQNRDNNTADSYKEKRFDDKGVANSENKVSTLEKYKIKTNISPGEIVELEFVMRDIVSAAQKLTSRLDMNMFQHSLETCQILMQYEILEPQFTLLSWVFKPVISPRGLYYLDKQIIVNALGALQTVLWARGHRYLALLATCHHITSEREMIVSPIDSKMRLPKEIADEVEKLYPFTRLSTSKKRIDNKNSNIAINDINELAEQLTSYSWRLTADSSLIEQELNSTSRRMTIKPDIKQIIGNLVVEIGSRSWI